MPHNKGLSLLEVLVVVAIISASLALVLPQISFQPRSSTFDLIDYLKTERAAAIINGHSTQIQLKDDHLTSTLTNTTYPLGDQHLSIHKPEPSQFLPHQDVAMFFADGTAIVSEFDVLHKDVEGTSKLLYKVRVNPFDSAIIHFNP